MTSPRGAEFQRQKHLAAMKRYRLRKAGLLPPFPVCTSCGARCTTDQWLPLCSVCGRGKTPRRLRLAAEQILAELRAEARGEAA
jgi:hypothetical protein